MAGETHRLAAEPGDRRTEILAHQIVPVPVTDDEDDSLHARESRVPTLPLRDVQVTDT